MQKRQSSKTAETWRASQQIRTSPFDLDRSTCFGIKTLHDGKNAKVMKDLRMETYIEATHTIHSDSAHI